MRSNDSCKILRAQEYDAVDPYILRISKQIVRWSFLKSLIG